MPNPFEKYPASSGPKLEHLEKGIPPIMFCLGTSRQFKKEPGPEKKFFDYGLFKAKKPRHHNVDYFGNPEELAASGFKNNGNYSYVISPVDSLDKFSSTYRNCTGVIVSGINKKTGKNISFISHQDPHHFLQSGAINFIDDLTQRLNQLKNLSRPGSIDAAIIGGNYLTNNRELQEDYLESIELLSKTISGALGFNPVVLTGPKDEPGDDDIFYINNERRIYIKRPNVGNKNSESFSPDTMDEQKKKWI